MLARFSRMATEPRPIAEIAEQLGIGREHFVPYGDWMAKLRPGAIQGRDPGRLILVTAITPTPAGEGKTTTSIGLAQGLAAIGEKPVLALREPSLGPIFGVKGGGTGGGRASLYPPVEINLHFTGDFHAITSAHNLLAAMVDNHIQQGNTLGIDPRRVTWPRVIDMNDRALRNIIVGLGGFSQGVPRETSFDITAASEVMATLCLAEDMEDLRARLSRLLVGQTYGRDRVTADQLQAVGAMMVLLKDAMLPNLVQTIEGVPAIVHGGPFANIAHGCNSVIATRTAMALGDWCITEAGFGADLGAEKFYDIKCASTDLATAAVVVVATCRALKMHGGRKVSELADEDVAAIESGVRNLEKHIENVQGFGQRPIVAINRFPTDTDRELDAVRKACERLGVPFAMSEGFIKGGNGTRDLATLVVEHAAKTPPPVKRTYEWSEPIKKKIEKIATKIYGASSVTYTSQAEADVRTLTKLGYGELPVCMAKTQSSLSDDPKKINRPTDFEVTVRGVVPAAGAGFVVALLGEMMRMPGLPKIPTAAHIDLKDGEVSGVAVE
ncbi:MAG: formate--tetrahydrofolate ligase [Planctomycetes bacterium]|nr:formate--tetrahydrofolate ligase [Planctomycetota bacterium]MCB9916949.1 formate--tetrahydrofolate ligase [Planctomycetota bacterium]